MQRVQSKNVMLRQIKLTNGEEIICKLLNTEDSKETGEILVNDCLRLQKIDLNRNVQYHTFRPCMIMKDEVADVISINTMHIVAMCIPSIELKTQFKLALRDIKESANEKEHYSLDDWMKKLDEMQTATEYDMIDDGDSNGKVISLADYNKDKLH